MTSTSACARVLWHRVHLEIETPVSGPWSLVDTWPIDPVEFEVTYRVTAGADPRLQLFEQGDPWTDCAADELWSVLSDRIVGRVCEVAERRGWTPFRGTVLADANERTCLVGPAAARRDAAQSVPGRIEAGEWWLAREGQVLPLGLTSETNGTVITAGPPAHLYCPGSGEPGPALLSALLAAAASTGTRHADLVGTVARLIGQVRNGSGTPPPGWTGW